MPTYRRVALIIQFYSPKRKKLYYDISVNMTTTKLGREGEQKAVEFLQEQGIEILTRNFRSPYGEVDIIGKSEKQIIFFEVKTRTSDTCGNPEDSITTRKKEKLIATALHYLQEKDLLSTSWRIDVISIFSNDETFEYEWFENAVTCS